jgi:hypothetical protein
MTAATELLATLRVIEMNDAQLTVAEFRQLDIVAIEELHPLGRVNVQDGSSRSPSERWVSPWVIGRHVPGADDNGRAPLARSLLQPKGWDQAVVAPFDLTGPVTACRALPDDGWTLDGRPFTLHDKIDVHPCEHDEHRGATHVDGAQTCEQLWTADAKVIGEIRAALDMHAHIVERHKSGAQLPLVVLA